MPPGRAAGTHDSGRYAPVRVHNYSTSKEGHIDRRSGIVAEARSALEAVDRAGGIGEEKLRLFIRGMLLDSEQHGSLLYFGDYSYLEAPQRAAISTWADRLKDLLIKFLKEGMEDGSIVQCEPEIVVNLVLGMLIWMAKWAPSIEGLTVDRLMNAIDAFGFCGLDRRIAPSSKKR